MAGHHCVCATKSYYKDLLVGVVGIYLPGENEEPLVSGMMRAATPALDTAACGAKGGLFKPSLCNLY